MYTNFDYEEERQSEEDRLNQFFGEFSSEARIKLMSKNLVKPQSLYDVFYPSIKKDLLSKNVNLLNIDLDEFSQEIRNNQLAKVIEKVTSLEEQSEDFRNSLLVRNQLHQDVEKLLDLSEQKRKDLLSKNSSSPTDLLKDSESAKNKNISKNKENPSLEKQINANQDNYRLGNLSKNSSKEQDLEGNSSDFRKNELAKNLTIVSDLEKDSLSFRNSDLSKNKPNESDVETDSQDYRKSNLSHNTFKESDLETFSENFRVNDLSKNDSKETDLETNSTDFRNANLSKNDSKETVLEIDSEKARKDGLAKNDHKITDLETSSFNLRKANLAPNSTNPTDLESDSIEFRKVDLSFNNSIKHDLEKESVDFRNGDLSKNDSKKSDLEKDSTEFRNADLSANVKKISDIEVDSDSFRNSNLAGNIKKESDLEKDSTEFRNADLSANVKKISDIEVDSDSFRNSNLAGNVPVIRDIEADSVSYRNADLAVNDPVVTDLETDSIARRNANLAVNIPSTTDIETDSAAFRNADLAANTPNVTDLETDSAPFRIADLASNIPNVTDLETDSVPYRNNELAENVPIVTDLETDSVPFRNTDLAANTPIVTDLETDSVLYRNNELAINVPIVTDIEIDSVPYRDNELAINVPANTDIETDSAQFRSSELATNVPTGQVLDSHINQYGTNSNPTDEKNNNLAKNASTHQTIDNHFNQYGGMSSGHEERYLNLNKNVGFGPLGVNVMGFGTSVYLGVSAVWVQGLLFRNLLFLKNKYKAGGVAGVSSSYYREADASTEGLLRDTLKVPSMPEIHSKKALPMNPEDTINNHVAFYSEIKSPIERNLTRAYQSVILQKDSLQFYAIRDNKSYTTYNIDYDLNNEKITQQAPYGLKTTLTQTLPAANINYLMRQYLKYSNAYALSDDGSLKETNSDNDIDKLYSTIWQITVGDARTKSIQDLIVSYNAFAEERRRRIKKATTSLNAPAGTYFTGDVERKFDENYGDLDNTNIAATKYAGNPLHDSGFNTKVKGVRNILKRIAESSIEISNNYANIQGQKGEVSKSFVIGKKDGVVKKVYQKYTIANPYAPKNAGKLLFYFKNYAIPSDQTGTMYFPPYIASFQNSDNASWNATNFLGRPEAVYTYNNSSRDGTISFFVLTDYAERVLIGRNADASQAEIFVDLNKNFTQQNTIQKINSLTSDALLKSTQDKTKELKKKQEEEKTDVSNPTTLPKTEGDAKANNSGTGGNVKNDNSSELGSTNAKLDNEKKESIFMFPGTGVLESTYKTPYTESKENGVNVNDFLMNIEQNNVDGYIESKPSDNFKRINEMLKSLTFQPAYFSGNLIDFKRRMEFLSKMTRPANNMNSSDGFSFTKPPVCHMRLGDWFNHDIIVNSVSYDYSNAPWTLDDKGMNQPMWASVTVSFNIVGPAGDSGGVPLTSSDREGFFGVRAIR